jgi:hypothetical protein
MWKKRTIEDQVLEIYEIWLKIDSCDCVYKIEQNHDYLHPPKCLNECGGFMSPQERIDAGLSELKTF